MTKVHPPDHPRAILDGWGLTACHRLGQNFVVAGDLLQRIVDLAEVGPEHVVLEVGTGLGRLTAALADRAAVVVSVEIDSRLFDVAQERLDERENVTLINADFLASKHLINPVVTDAVRGVLGSGQLKVVANLPYQISSPAIIDLLEWEVKPVEIDVMLQAEVADRLQAAPGSRAYGPLSVFAAYWAGVERLLKVPPSAFWPQPKVSSALVRITPRAARPAAVSYGLFSEVVRRLMQGRRKGVGRTLESGWGRQLARGVLEGLGIERLIRPERLSPEDFARISNALYEAGAVPADGQ